MGRFGIMAGMVRKDLLRQIRSPMAMLIMLAFPLFFAALLGVSFGGGTPQIQVRLLVENQDDSFLSDLLIGAMSNEQVSKYFDITQVDAGGLEMIRNDEASALLRIPEHFGQKLIDGEPVALELVRNPSESILPEVAEQALTVLTDLLDAASRILRKPLDEMAPLMEASGDDLTADQVARLSVAFYDALDSVEHFVLPPVITLETVQLTDAGAAGKSSQSVSSIFVAVLPGIAVWALFMVGDMAMRDIVVEATAGTLTRQMCSPISAWDIIAGKALYTAALSGISLILLTTIGAIVFREALSFPGFVLLSAALVFAVTGLSASIYGLAQTERQGTTVGSIMLMLFALLGGSFFDISGLPDSVQRLAPLSPFYWGTTGYASLIRDGGGIADIARNAAVLAGVGVVGLTLGSALLGRKVRKGQTA